MKWITLDLPWNDEIESELFEAGVLAFEVGSDGHRCLVEDRKIIPSHFQHAISNESEVPQLDWENQWYQSGYVQPLGTRFVLATPDRASEATGDVIIIDPRDAFGNGLHPTTQLCAAAMESVQFNPKCQVLDVGTGTGILAILAEKLGASSVMACDNDPKSKSKALENVALNQCRHIEVRLSDFSNFKPPQKFDLIVANIVLPELQPILPQVINTLNATGQLILSGYRSDGIAQIESIVCPMRFKRRNQFTKEGWVCEHYSRD